jgi:hypothetical protein
MITPLELFELTREAKLNGDKFDKFAKLVFHDEKRTYIPSQFQQRKDTFRNDLLKLDPFNKRKDYRRVLNSLQSVRYFHSRFKHVFKS